MTQVDIGAVVRILKKEVTKWNVPVAELIEIQTNDPEKVLMATILSARTKDETTAKVCVKLFAKVNKVADLKKLSVEEIAELIYPVGFYKTKAKHLKQLPEVLQEKFNGVLPETVEELCELPGVGRKTANLVVAVGFRKPGMCVDVHCHRIFNRFGYIKTRNPYETEMTLRKKLPPIYWQEINMMLVALGQNICRPISPFCSKCPVKKYCKKIGVEKSR